MYDILKFLSDTDETIFSITRYMMEATNKDNVSSTLEYFFTFSEEFNKWFETPMYTKMKIRYLLNKFFNVSRPEFYVTLQDKVITGSTYSEFFNSPEYYQTEEINHVQRHRRSIHGHHGINLFKNTGEMIAFGLHTSFDYKLWMCEQGGVTCRYEADRQINDADLLPFWEFEPTPSKRLDPPVFPGTGCPWLTISDKNKSDYGIRYSKIIDEETLEEVLIPPINGIHYYFTKNNTNATITVRICDRNGIKPDCWQSVAFGKFESSPGYKFPLYVAGGTSALSPDVWVYWPPSTRVNGYEYDLSMRNINFSNSNLLHPAKMRNGNLSNYRVLGNNGHWRNVYSIAQSFDEFQYYHPCGVIYQWGVPVGSPEMIYDREHHTGVELLNQKGKTDSIIGVPQFDAPVKGRP